MSNFDGPKLHGPTNKDREPKLRVLAEQVGLRYITNDALSIWRRRCGAGWSYFAGDKRRVRDSAIVRRLTGLAVPPAYRDVRYAVDPAAHLQAIGRDAAGRLQYRYHPKWDDVREARKARRVAVLANSAATHPPRRQAAPRRSGTHAGFRSLRRCRAGGSQRHSSGARKLRPRARNTGSRHFAEIGRHDSRRPALADIRIKGRQENYQALAGRPLDDCHCATAAAARTAIVPVSQRSRSRSGYHCTRSERFSA